MNGIQGLGWIVLPTRDIPALVDWFRDVLGLTLLRSGETFAQFDLGQGIIVELMGPSRRAEEPPKRWFHRDAALVLRVYGLEAVIADLQSKGVPFISPIHEIPNGRITFFHDPEGHVFALQERSPESKSDEDVEARKRWEKLHAAS